MKNVFARSMGKLATVCIVLVALASGIFWYLTIPRSIDASALSGHVPDIRNGENLFWAGGCKSCHAKSAAKDPSDFRLGGGDGLVTPFGTFYAPNISPDPNDGIGDWSTLEFVNAMKLGVAPQGRHLYPAFPFTSYQRMHIEDIIDLKAFMDTLPAVKGNPPDHELVFPFNIRRGLGLWKLLYVDGTSFEAPQDQSEIINRGAYLVNGPGHCGECHTPRNIIGGPKMSRTLTGGPSPEGKGVVPNITQDDDGIGSWSEEDILFMFTDGLTPSYEVVGGAMRSVQENLAKLSVDDQIAIAKYLKSLTEIPSVE